MQEVVKNYYRIKQKSQDEGTLIRKEQLQKEALRIQQLIGSDEFLLASDKLELNEYKNVYRVAISQIEKMTSKFTKPNLLRQRLNYIFENKIQSSETDRILQKSSLIRDSQIEIPSLQLQNQSKEHAIDAFHNESKMSSPDLRNFFAKKQQQIANKSTTSNFRDIVKNSSQDFNRSINRSISRSREQPSRVSKNSFNSSFRKKPNPEAQLQKVLEENKRMKQEYDEKLKREVELSQFEKNLLKQQKNRYMLKIEELESELENLYRDNYRLKETEEVLKQKEKISRLNNEMASFGSVEERSQRADDRYYEPYELKVKPNDLKRLNEKCQSEIDSFQPRNSQQNEQFIAISNENNFGRQLPKIESEHNKSSSQQIVVDVLGNQLQKELQEMDLERSKVSRPSNLSQRSSKKWSRQYNKHIYENTPHESRVKAHNSNELSDIFKDFDEISQKNCGPTDINKSEDRRPSLKSPGLFGQDATGNKSKSRGHQEYESSVNSQICVESPFPGNVKKDTSKTPSYGYPPSHNKSNSFRQANLLNENNGSPKNNNFAQNQVSYSFTNKVDLLQSSPTQQKEYPFLNSSNGNSFDSFSMTRTYLHLDNETSEANQYIDSKTSTRNKVAFFKDSLIVLKNERFQLAFKRSSFSPGTMDKVRVLFFIKNKTSLQIEVNLRYEFNAQYLKVQENEKIQKVAPYSQSREDIEVHLFSNNDLNEVIDIMVTVDRFQKFSLWMPILWMNFVKDDDNFKMPHYNEEITILPDRQFKSYETAKTIMPLMFGGIEGLTEWAYLSGHSKFGPCQIKLTWENNELRIETNAKWIDLLAFVMHHVK